MTEFLILKTGSAPPVIQHRFGDFEHWFIDALGPAAFDYRVVPVHDDADLPVDTDNLAGVLVTGSPAMVSHRHPWSERTADWLREVHACGLPLLGVCYGHQLLAHALGGRVGPSPAGRQMGTREISIHTTDDHPLLGGFGARAAFHVTHVEAVLEPPPEAQILAASPTDPFHALQFGPRSWGVQFHPEFNEDIMTGYIQARASVLAGEGIAAGSLIEQVRPAPAGVPVLRRFAELASGWHADRAV